MTDSRHSRRHFINAASASLAAFAGAPELVAGVQAQAAPTSGGTSPELIVVNAKVYTMDSRAPQAEAFAVPSVTRRRTVRPATPATESAGRT